VNTAIIASLLLAATICFAFVALSQRSKLLGLISENNDLRKLEKLYLETLVEKSTLSERCKNLSDRIEFLENSEEKLANLFKVISSDALSRNNQSFLDLAKTSFEQLNEKAQSDFTLKTKSMEELVAPIKSALDGVGNKLWELEKSRIGAYESLKQQVNDLISTQNSLKTETHHLVSALRTPSVRGRWGEVQLRRVVELAGMLEHCDFKEQVSSEADDAKIRPDMVIYLPGNQHVIVDAKVPLSAYLEAIETNDDGKKKILLKDHAKQIRNHISSLSGKKYWSQFEQSPEFLVMFLPGEVFFSSATEQDPSLLEFAMQERVIIATPTILLALLHTIALGWRQQNLAENARQIIKMGQELYKRLGDMTQHIADLGKNIGSAVSSYNQTVASLENRVLVSARKFKELEVHEKNIVELKPVEKNIREPQKK
jgi:DNA recombination protein RmuC